MRGWQESEGRRKGTLRGRVISKEVVKETKNKYRAQIAFWPESPMAYICSVSNKPIAAVPRGKIMDRVVPVLKWEILSTLNESMCTIYQFKKKPYCVHRDMLWKDAITSVKSDVVQNCHYLRLNNFHKSISINEASNLIKYQHHCCQRSVISLGWGSCWWCVCVSSSQALALLK